MCLGQRICHNIPIRSVKICATKSTISSPFRKQNGAVTLVLLSTVCVCSALLLMFLRSSLPTAHIFLTCSLPFSFPYPTHQALRAEDWAVFPPPATTPWVFPPHLCSPLPPVCPCSKSHRHRRHPPLTRSPSMSSRPTRPSQQCPCPTLCWGHR